MRLRLTAAPLRRGNRFQFGFPFGMQLQEPGSHDVIGLPNNSYRHGCVLRPLESGAMDDVVRVPENSGVFFLGKTPSFLFGKNKLAQC